MLTFILNLTPLEVFSDCACVSSPGIESTLESQTDMESAGQQSDDASLPSTSQDPGNVFCLLTDRCQSNYILCKVVIKVKTVLN